MEEELTQGIPAARPRHKGLSGKQIRAARQSLQGIQQGSACIKFLQPHTDVLLSCSCESTLGTS